MEQLFFSAAHFAQAKSLAQGQLNVSELLRSLEALDCVEIETALPPADLILHWQEYSSPRLHSHLGQALLSGKLMNYKFQYMGHFSLGEQAVECRNWLSINEASHYETFEANLGEARLHRNTLDSQGQGVCNVTWLLDFLQNAHKIEKDSLRKEVLVWRETVDGRRLTLKAETPKAYEQEDFVFHPEYKALRWEHKVVVF